MEKAAADRAVGVERLGQIFVCAVVFLGNTCVALVAMDIINAEALSNAADLALGAVKNILARGIIIELALGAEVSCKSDPAVHAFASNGLLRFTL